MTEATEAGQQEGLASQASAKMEHAASAAQEQASEWREQGSARLRDQFDQRSTQAGSQVRSLAEALRRSGTELGNEGNGSASQLTKQAADRIERVGRYLEQKSGDDLMQDIERFARRRPWMLAGLGMLAGVAAARFVKASSERRHGQQSESHQWPTRPSVASSDRAAYGQAELPSGSGKSRNVGTEVPPPRSDDPLERDRHAETR
jgi:ElaB/YqjD/DUF883 family membrane-anchored ribosome-binding protein